MSIKYFRFLRKIVDSSKLKEFADDNFKFDENGRKLSKRVENTVGKGEIARYEQFLLFPLCFQKACFPGASKGVIVYRVKLTEGRDCTYMHLPLEDAIKFILVLAQTSQLAKTNILRRFRR